MVGYCQFLESDQCMSLSYIVQLYCDCLATFGSTVVQQPQTAVRVCAVSEQWENVAVLLY